MTISVALGIEEEVSCTYYQHHPGDCTQEMVNLVDYQSSAEIKEEVLFTCQPHHDQLSFFRWLILCHLPTRQPLSSRKR